MGSASSSSSGLSGYSTRGSTSSLRQGQEGQHSIYTPATTVPSASGGSGWLLETAALVTVSSLLAYCCLNRCGKDADAFSWLPWRGGLGGSSRRVNFEMRPMPRYEPVSGGY